MGESRRGKGGDGSHQNQPGDGVREMGVGTGEGTARGPRCDFGAMDHLEESGTMTLELNPQR